MVFSSPIFLFLFLPIALTLQLCLRRSIKASNILLLALSLFFYAWGEPVYVILMALTTLVNHICAKRGDRRLLTVAVVWSLGTLIFFKYTDFLLGSVNALFRSSLPLTGIPLPIGISFFTFQAMSYTIDVYRGDAKKSLGYFDTLLYISLFPQLIAGPIVKYQDVCEQIHHRELSIEKAASGMRRFAFGLSKKVLIANTLAVTADAVFALNNAELGMLSAWLGAICYMLQIYFDFSGYSDMAIGLGRMFGFEFMENFLYPYTASSMRDFWRRWHVSLSTWFKLYVYIPLGGNRKGKLMTGVNKLIVFLLTGLWHGASWSFAIWGLMHGAFLMLEAYNIIKPEKWPKLLSRMYVLLAVTLAFVLFRADSIHQAAGMVSHMFGFAGFDGVPHALFTSLLSPLLLITLFAAIIASSDAAHKLGLRLEKKGRGAVIYVAAFALMLLSALCLSTSAYNPFIYFRF